MVVLMISSPNARSAKLSSMSSAYIFRKFILTAILGTIFLQYIFFCYQKMKSNHSLILMSGNFILFSVLYVIEIIYNIHLYEHEKNETNH